MSQYDNYLYFNSTNTASTISSVLYNNGSVYWGDPLTFRAVQTPQGMKAVPYTASYKPVAEGVARPEDPIAWLKRRVDEICWVPA